MSAQIIIAPRQVWLLTCNLCKTTLIVHCHYKRDIGWHAQQKGWRYSPNFGWICGDCEKVKREAR